MRPDAEVIKWQSKVEALEQMMNTAPSPQIAEMLSDARNALRFVKARRENVSKQKTDN